MIPVERLTDLACRLCNLNHTLLVFESRPVHQQITLIGGRLVSRSAAGLLAGVQALHEYIVSNLAALVAWDLYFALMLFLELVVVLMKFGFGETVDDELEQKESS